MVMLFARSSMAACINEVPEEMLPIDDSQLVWPVSFSWNEEDSDRDIYLNVAENSDFSPINVINWKDNGDHRYFWGNFDKNLEGQRLYWRLVTSDCGGNQIISETRSFVVKKGSFDPYYVVFRVGWPGGANNFNWDPLDVNSIKTEDIKNMKDDVGGGNGNKKLAFEMVVPYFMDGNMVKFEDELRKLLEVAEEADLPILIALDGFEWWQGRPDLWNWWDSNKPGFDVNNRTNVEQTSWDDNSSVKGAWRNWGAPLRLGVPHPNLGSEKFIEENKKSLRRLVPIITNWYEGLSEDKKYLFAGVKVGWEINIGYNYFYPKDEGVCVRKELSCNAFEGKQVGYAGVKSLGIKNSGEITSGDLNKVVDNYMSELSEEVYEMGVPRRKIFSHVGIDEAPEEHTVHGIGVEAAINKFANPGLSFYSLDNGVFGIPELGNILDKTTGQTWAVAEWGGPGARSFSDMLEEFFGYKNNKFVSMFVNFDKDDVGLFLKESDCWINPTKIEETVEGSSVKIKWSTSSESDQHYLNISSSDELTENGMFADVDIANSRVTGQYERVIDNLADGEYYWKIISSGCGNRRVSSDMGHFVIGESEQCVKSDGDYDDDGKVDISDLVAWYRAYKGEYDINADFDCVDGVGIGDLIVWYGSYR